jgi:hypothetical protein
VFKDHCCHGLLKTERLAEISVQHALQVASILDGNRHIEPQSVAQLLQIVAQHLRHGITWNNMRQQKNHRDN